MTRGKHAARASKARAEQAGKELAELKDALHREREVWKQERADLRNEVQQLRNRLVSEVSDLAKVEITKAQEAASRSVRDAKKEFERRATETLVALYTDPVIGRKVGADMLDRFAKMLGVSATAALDAGFQEDWHEPVPQNREYRRRVANRSAAKTSKMLTSSDAELAVMFAKDPKLERRLEELRDGGPDAS